MLLPLMLAASLAVSPAAADPMNDWFAQAKGATDPQLRIDDYTKALEAWVPDDGIANKNAIYVNRGAAYGELGNKGQAIEDYDRALALDRDDVVALLDRGN